MFRNYIKSSLLICFVAFAIKLNAQQTVSNYKEHQLFDLAVQTFDRGEYLAAKDLFADYLKDFGTNTSAEYYYQTSRLKLGESGAVAALEVLASNEYLHPLTGRIQYSIGNYYFDQGNYQSAIEAFREVNFKQLSKSEEEMVRFRLAYSQLKTQNLSEAITGFNTVLNYHGVYFDDASYYLGTIYFENKEYQKALNVLKGLDEKEGAYKDESIIMIAGTYFHTSQFNLLYPYVEKHLTSSISDKNKHLNKLAGEAYFQSESYDQAQKFLQRYVDLNGNRAEADTYYKLGFCYYQKSNNAKAIENFKKSGLDKGALGKISSFYLGQLYLKEGNLNFAYSAFKTVVSAEERLDFQEEANFLIGKINFQRAQYGDAITDLMAFMEKYPNSRWKNEATELLAQSYVRTSNYDQAIAHLEAIRNKSLPLKKAYQQVTFQKGQLLYNDSRFQQALVYFEKSITTPQQKDITAQAYFLMGECQSRLNHPELARPAYVECMNRGDAKWSAQAAYALGYLYYNEKQYDQAQTYFQRFLNNSSSSDDVFSDAKLRLADCYYVQKKYDQAISGYLSIQDPANVIYAKYQLGMIYRLQNNLEKSELNFQLVAQDRASGLGDNALFQLGELYIENSAFKRTISSTTQLLNDYPESNLVPYALGQKALAHFNLGEFGEAKLTYETILSNYIAHEAANSALLGLQELEKKGLEIPDFQNYMQEYQKAHPDDGSLEVVAFESAKASFYNQKYQEVKQKLTQFIQKYPNSAFMEDARYFLADSYYRGEEWADAAKYFEDLIKMQSKAYTTRALDKRGKSLMSLKNYTDALSNYHLLYKKSLNAKDVYKANEGLMYAFYGMNNTDSTLIYADRIMDGEWKPIDAEVQVALIKARIYTDKANYQLAIDELIKVVNDSQNEVGAEANYLMAKVYYAQGQNKRSLEILFNLNKTYGSYQKWIGKSFLLIADNYLAMGELLQARATIESIIANSSNTEVVKEAKAKLASLEAKEEEVLVPDTLQIQNDNNR